MSSSSYGRFVVQYISDAIKQNKEPVEAALEEIENIDKLLHEAEELKVRRMKVLKVLEHFGDDSFRRKRNVNVPASEDVDEDVQIKNIQEAIISVLSQNPGQAMDIRTIIQRVGMYDNDTLVIRAVKNLGDEERITRDDEKRVILKA